MPDYQSESVANSLPCVHRRRGERVHSARGSMWPPSTMNWRSSVRCARLWRT